MKKSLYVMASEEKRKIEPSISKSERIQWMGKNGRQKREKNERFFVEIS